jgi:glycosyltransferase involved in cell wall biosynthesis
VATSCARTTHVAASDAHQRIRRTRRRFRAMTAPAERADRLRVAHVSFFADTHRRDAEALLRAWPRLPAVAAAVARAGVDVSVVQAAHSRQTLVRDGVTFRFIDDTRGMPNRFLRRVPVPRRPTRLLDEVAAVAPDVVHVQGLIYPVAIRQLAGVLNGTPILVQDHGASVPRGLRRRAWRWASRSIAGVAFTARQQAAPFFEARAFRADLPVFEVVEGSTTFVTGDREAARRVTGMYGDPCLLWTGHLDANKDPLTTLAAFELAAPELPDARLWCCFGDAPLLVEVQRRIDGSPVLRERVTLLGRRPHAEMELRFRAADFFVQMSHREVGGLSLLEALACGTTPLVSDIPPTRRMVDGVGALTRVGDAAALAGAMVEWSKRDPAALRSAARDRFERALTFDVMGRELRAVYEALVG